MIQIPIIVAPKANEPLLKRPLDVILSILMLVFSAPLPCCSPWPSRLKMGVPSSTGRSGGRRGGSRFRTFKFRTMIPNRDEVFGVKQARVNDPRITFVGRFLRATGLDELPQILNIFLGQMSFVGPRALAIGEVLYDENGQRVNYEEILDFWQRLSIRPGLTSIATIYKAKDIPPRKKFRYDLLYIRKQSFWLDLKLIIVSFRISFLGKWEYRGNKI